jgi:hypothetical protein
LHFIYICAKIIPTTKIIHPRKNNIERERMKAGRKPTGRNTTLVTVSIPNRLNFNEMVKRAGFTGNRSAYITWLLEKDAARLGTNEQRAQ